jgi:hypothetical protein
MHQQLKLTTLGTALALLLLAGCAATGKWSLQEIDPSAARADFEPHTLTLQPDQTYYADTNQQVTTGVWRWEGPMTDGMLILDERNGQAKSYTAAMPNNNVLKLKTEQQGRAVEARFDRKY